MATFQIVPLFLMLLTYNLSPDHVATASESDCPTSSFCSVDIGPVIRFPFRLISQPKHCGSPGFELTCRGNQTILNLPASSDLQYLVVDSIDYYYQRLDVAHPQQDFYWSFLLNLNLSNSPYTLSYPYSLFSVEDRSTRAYGSYTLMNCSIFPYDHGQFICKGSPGRAFYVLSSDTDLKKVPKSCNPFGRIRSRSRLPFFASYVLPYYLRDNSFSLDWSTPGCKNCELYSERCQIENGARNETICFWHEPLAFGYSYDQKDSPAKKVIPGLTVSISLVIVATIAAIRIYASWQSKRKKEAEHRLKVENFLKDYKSLKPTRYTYAEIKKIANHFKSPLGQGGYGTVFKGNLRNGIPVAVKILKRSIEESADFINEVGTIGRIHHVNVVRLLGFCADGYERALVYEFMPNESLEKFIFSEGSKRPSLGWEKVQSIAIGIARGIEYLHEGCDQRILHFDIKPHNVLLDENFHPKITDFGLAKLCSKEQSTVSMSVAKGTMGYIAPEVISRSFGNVSYKSDVYSFGVLLSEMVRGRKNDTNANAAEESGRAHFPEWIYGQLHQEEEKDLEIIEEENPLVAKRLTGEIEREIVGEEDALIAKKLSIVALWCMQWYPVNRPSIQRVVQMLEGSIESLVLPSNPFGSNSLNDTPSLRKKSQRTELTIIVE